MTLGNAASLRFRKGLSSAPLVRALTLMLALGGARALSGAPQSGGAVPGSRHPASGAFSPAWPWAWGKAHWPLGAAFVSGEGSTLEVGVYSANATAMLLEVYASDLGADAEYDYWMVKGPDRVWRAAIAGVPGKTLYAFRAWGPNWPFKTAWRRGGSAAGFISDCDALGNRFNPNKVLMDPYARELTHAVDSVALAGAGENFAMFASGGADVAPDQVYSGPMTRYLKVNRREVDTGRFAPKSVAFVDRHGFGTKPAIAQKDTAIYEAHLKGLTAHPSAVRLTAILSGISGFPDAKDVPAAYLGTYAGAGYMAGYLKDMGYTTVEFLPVQQTENDVMPAGRSGGNYWGYMTDGYFAPDRRYAYDRSLGGPTAEFKAMVGAFHAAGLEVYLDVVYNHTSEGGLWGSPSMASLFEFRGLDNRDYYSLSGRSNEYYYDTTGCGNNFNAGSAPVRKLILDSLNYWSSVMGVDGFRFDECLELGREGAGAFMGRSSPTLASIARLAADRGFKIVAEPWDSSDWRGLGNFPAGWGAWNGNYRDAVRDFIRGKANAANGVGYADAFCGDYQHFDRAGGPQKSVNMIDCHDGFVLTDLVSYDAPRTSLLAWPFGPSDGGAADNRSSSWLGDAGMRRQAIRNFWAFQVLSRGVPMQVWGDELGRTVNGNNNAYNLDSVATWNNYAMISSANPDALPTGDGGAYDDNLGTFAGGTNQNFLFLRYLLNLRKAHAAFRQADYRMPIVFYGPDGGAFSQSSSLASRIAISGSSVGDKDFLFLVNLSGWGRTFALPPAPAGKAWVCLVDTDQSDEGTGNAWDASSARVVEGRCVVAARSEVLLMAR